ncbi:MAG: ABC transporter ATP-binding protein [Planctomycetota bacterium]|nr:MAG: ABC transporter ATP-binding protein [Planctomycetota bacterium]
MNQAENVLEMRAVSKLYGSRPVLDRLDLAISTGGIVGLLGKNGAGKTTLLRCALGLAKPQHGTVTILGEPAWNLSASAKELIGYVPQTPQLYHWMRVQHIIDYTGSFYRRWNAQLARDLVADWKIPPDQRAGTLSVGEAQKLAIVLALAHEPDFLLLDEPVASLDPAARREFLKVVLEIAAGGSRSVLFSTHITSDLERVANHVAILQNGQISFFGELGELKDQIKRLRLISTNTFPERFELPGILRQRIEGNQALVTTRTITPELLDKIETSWHATVEIQDLNLEEIFLELHDDE